MPNLDRSGPFGQGPRSGRGMGNCSGQGDIGSGAGRGRGAGRQMGGRGRGLGINAGQGNSWLGAQLSSLFAAIEKLTEQLNKK